jgi:O-antigen/teichoic acid export membrane protein
LSIVSFLACGLILFSDWIGYILGSESFHKSLYLIPLIVFGQYLMAINPIYKRHISFSKKTFYTSIIVFIAGALNIWLNFLYIPRFGAAAGAYTTVASYLIMFVLTYLAVKYFIKLHVTPILNLTFRIFVVAAVCGFYYVELYYLDLSVFLQILLKFGVLLLSGLVLLWKILPFHGGKITTT